MLVHPPANSITRYTVLIKIVTIAREKKVVKMASFCLLMCGAIVTPERFFAPEMGGRPVLEGSEEGDP